MTHLQLLLPWWVQINEDLVKQAPNKCNNLKREGSATCNKNEQIRILHTVHNVLYFSVPVILEIFQRHFQKLARKTPCTTEWEQQQLQIKASD